MSSSRSISRGRDHRFPGNRRGQAVIEFAFVSVALLLFITGVAEMSRMFFVMNTMRHASREGARFGTIHPAWAQGASPESSYYHADPENIAGKVRNAAVGLDASKLQSSTSYPDGAPQSGQRIRVTLSYTFDTFLPFLGRIPLTHSSVMTIE